MKAESVKNAVILSDCLAGKPLKLYSTNHGFEEKEKGGNASLLVESNINGLT
ncbi:hypothetical protein GCM10007978_16090 [Shewanella hanedai]|nr:hypothetical protein GCM10007978_16090 [Shewanella hanedai]